MKNKIVQLILPLFDPFILEWQNYASDFFYHELDKVDQSGSSTLDEGETPELPQIVFDKLNESWEVDLQLVDRIIGCLRENTIAPAQAKEVLQQEVGQLREMVDGLLHNQALEDAYQQAKTVTWAERLLGTNHEDVSAFYMEVSLTLSRAVFEAVEWHIAKTLMAVSANM